MLYPTQVGICGARGEMVLDVPVIRDQIEGGWTSPQRQTVGWNRL